MNDCLYCSRVGSFASGTEKGLVFLCGVGGGVWCEWCVGYGFLWYGGGCAYGVWVRYGGLDERKSGLVFCGGYVS